MDKEYRVVFNESGEARFVHLDGSEVPRWEAVPVYWKVKEQYEEKRYVYFAHDWLDRDLIKIGVTNDPDRRENEIEAWMIHFVACSRSTAFQHERELHKIFEAWREKGEWFRFEGEDRQRFIEPLKVSVTNERQLVKQIFTWRWNKVAKIGEFKPSDADIARRARGE
jgi:hypothetical protein